MVRHNEVKYSYDLVPEAFKGTQGSLVSVRVDEEKEFSELV